MANPIGLHSSLRVSSIKIFYNFAGKEGKKMEAIFKHLRYIDLATLSTSGQRKLIDIYKRLLQEFPQKEKKKKISDFEKQIIELSQFNNKKNVMISKDIDISRLTDKMYDEVF